MSNDNIQKKLTRVRPPRVKITYDLETEGAIIKKELPCIIAIIADFTGTIDEADPIHLYNDRKFVYIDPDNINDVLLSFKPMALCHVGLDPTKMEAYQVKFQKIDQFHPSHLIENIPIIKERFDKRTKLSDLKTRISNSSKLYDAAEQLITGKQTAADAALGDYKFISDTQKAYLTDLFASCIGLTLVNENAILSIQAVIDALDKEINLLVNQALHSPEYKKLEATWLGLRHMIANLELGESLKIRVLNASFKEINSDLIRALEFDQSFLFQQLYESEYGTYGGNPYTILLVDFLLEKTQEHFAFLHKLSEVSCAAHLPTVVGVNSTFFDLETYQDLHKPRMMSKILNSPEYMSFKSLRERDESRYLAIVCPSFMVRIPYGEKTLKVEGTTFEEDVSDHNNFAWSNSIYVYGTNVGQTFSRYNWFASIIGPENGGMVTNLPVYTFKDRDGDICIKCPTETTITDRREKEMSELEFIALCHCKDCDYSVFFSGQSVNKPLLFDKDIANSNARLSARFQYMLNCSRFAHYIKCIMRDKIGSFSDKTSIEKFLTIWINMYVLAMDEADQETKAKYPLREAKIEVVEVAGKPGCYDCVIHLKPHFQMEELTVSLRLVARIPVKE